MAHYQFIDIDRPNGHTVRYADPFVVADPSQYEWGALIGDFAKGTLDASVDALAIGQTRIYSLGGTKSTRVTRLA